RADVGGRGEGHDLVETEDTEAEIHHGARTFARIAESPVIGGQAPAHLDARSEARRESGHRQADESGKRSHVADLHGPQPEAVLRETGLDAGGERVALRARQDARK